MAATDAPAQRMAQPMGVAGRSENERFVCPGDDLDPSASALSPATVRNWYESVRTMSANTCASVALLLARETTLRPRKRAACNGFTLNTVATGGHQRRNPQVPVGLESDRTSASSTSSPSGSSIIACNRAIPVTHSSSRALLSSIQQSPSARHRMALPTSHLLRITELMLLRSSSSSTAFGSVRENHQRPNEALLTPERERHPISALMKHCSRRSGNDTPSAIRFSWRTGRVDVWSDRSVQLPEWVTT